MAWSVCHCSGSRTMSLLPIPSRPEELTAEWLGSVMSKACPGASVTAMNMLEVVHGAATKLKLALAYNETGRRARLPEVVWVKSGWEAHSEWLNSTSFIDAREARFYRDFAGPTEFNAPLCLYADLNEQGGGIVLLEDLVARGVIFGDARRSATVDQVAAMLENFARLHARWWCRPDASEIHMLDRPMRRDAPNSEWPKRNTPEVIARYLASPRGDQVPASVKNRPERIDAGFWAMVDDMAFANPGCVLHGDAHPGNSFFDADGRPGFYDWQTLSYGPWGHDVAYYIASALDIEERRKADRELIRHYLAELKAHGVIDPPGFDDAWLVMRRYIAYGLHIWISNPVEFQPEDVCTAMTTRLGTAAEDYEFFEAWGV